MSAGIGEFVDGEESVSESVEEGVNDVLEGNLATEEDLADAFDFDETLDLKVTCVEYADLDSGTLVHLFGRDEEGERHHIEVDGHDPSFYILEDEYDHRVDNHYAVKRAEKHDSSGDRYESLHSEPLVRIYTHKSSSVSDLRETFTQSFEADVMYDTRFLIDTEIKTGVSVDVSETGDAWKGDYRVDVGDLEPLSIDETPTPGGPKMVVLDIEVGAEDGVPDTSEARAPVTTIVGWDSYSEEYVGWLLRHEDHPPNVGEGAVLGMRLRRFHDESEMLDDFNQWLESQRPDIITGWYCIPEGERVQMADGSMRPIEDIEAGDIVVGKDDGDVVETEVKKTAETGEQDVVEIQTQFGKPLRVSEDHPVLVADDDEPRYIDAGDVENGQYVLAPKELPSNGSGGPSVQRAKQLGLVASDGSFSDDDGVVFYNNRAELHDEFPTDNQLSDANGTLKQRVFTDGGREESISRCTDIGLPIKRKDREEWSLETVFQWNDESVAAFLAGLLDGDGHVSNGKVVFNNGNDSARYWIERLLRRLGIWAVDGGEMEVHVGSSSVERFVDVVGQYVSHSKKSARLEDLSDGKSGREETVPPFMDRGAGTGTDTRRIVNDKKRRGINIKRHEVDDLGGDSEELDSFIFDKVTGVEECGSETCYDIETGTHNFVVNDRVVHNCNDFDLPYLMNRCRNLNTYSYRDWSPLGDVFETHFEPVVAGIECVDMLEAYKKTQIHKLQSKALEDVAQDEVGEGKRDVEQSHTEMWKQNPVEFLRYNKVDVELVHRIDESSGAIDLLDNLRNVVGCAYSDIPGGNIDMMDVLVLRKAREYGYALPTAESPDIGDYHGAYVFPPKAGLHEHVVYPDYSSLYPNMMYQCNVSPETIVGTKEDLEASEYTEEDCVWSYLDVDTPPSHKSDVEVEPKDMEKVYFVDPSIEEGFVRSVLGDVMGLADEYSGGMYEAVKRVRNSAYGVLGDSDSYGDGFRLFDWRMAEAVTLGGQRVLKAGSEHFVERANLNKSVMEDDAERAEIVGGDTDSYMTAMEFAEDGEEALEVAELAASETNMWLDGFAVEEFGLESESEARMELEVESYASRLFFKGDDEGRSNEGVKKRYAQAIEWNDDDLWLDAPDIGIKGFEYVRSDVASITQEVQHEIFQTILLAEDEAEAEASVKAYVTDVIEKAVGGQIDEKIGVPFGIGQGLSEYGSSDRRPQPWYKGAKFSNEFIYGGEAIGEGDKPLYFYVKEGQTGPHLRKTYKAHTAEDGDYVDCISVMDPDDVPEGVVLDRPKMVRKAIIDPCSAIWRTLGWGVEWAERAVEEATPASYYRDDGQEGLEAWEAM